ncbi:MAG: hypothetical protein AAFZ65_14295, partial [Planctomycetota bacterium]
MPRAGLLAVLVALTIAHSCGHRSDQRVGSFLSSDQTVWTLADQVRAGAVLGHTALGRPPFDAVELDGLMAR